MDTLRKQLLATIGVGVVAAGAVILAEPRTGDEVFCAAYGIIVDTEPVKFRERELFVGFDASERDECFGEFGHYMVNVAPGEQTFNVQGHVVDGIVWSDCIVSWPDGTRSSAEDTGIPCDPSAPPATAPPPPPMSAPR